ncbi:MAG: hypothetical protein IPH22_08640 [Nitrosomonas sp.]|nr:hypothetical protein [Nitrosomonas sp.]
MASLIVGRFGLFNILFWVEGATIVVMIVHRGLYVDPIPREKCIEITSCDEDWNAIGFINGV